MRCADGALLLYAVTDRTWLGGRTLANQVEDCLAGGATMVQLREKALGYGAFLAEALELKALCKRYGAPFLINDAVDIAEASDADGVHVGQGDMDIRDARQKLGPGKIIGVSVQTVAQALEAEKNGADYLGVGAVFPTASKADAGDVSHAALTQICAAVNIPVVAIGGINRHNIRELKGTGIDGVAVISALFAEKDIAGAAKALLALSKETVSE
ncbi:thiamine-phosphate diphosphorylase [Sporobacter termitidis DSM 10068]|uniref:Thiamine-phosphate synthase n=1 Tax=Sporobacter termitidis DSM 10068 TaxID=1123282 RepID=A0A1M5U6P5_9FIRM|nr:thiamine phosphate synthase [Sporobacter termitidis]SHH58551.1 thiamine-phosphate diphosphorylase [Sporobacter termitidis DSM 10068]